MRKELPAPIQQSRATAGSKTVSPTERDFLDDRHHLLDRRQGAMFVEKPLAQPHEWNEKHELKRQSEVVGEENCRQIEPE